MKMVDGHVVEQEDMLQRFSKFHWPSQIPYSVRSLQVLLFKRFGQEDPKHFPAESNGEEGVGPSNF